MESRIGVPVPSPAKFLAASFTGDEWAMYGIANYIGYDCELFFATTGGKTPIRTLTNKMAEFCFKTADCRRITVRVDETNKIAIRHNQLFGFTEEGRLRQASPEGNDILVFGLLRDECYGKILQKGK